MKKVILDNRVVVKGRQRNMRPEQRAGLPERQASHRTKAPAETPEEKDRETPPPPRGAVWAGASLAKRGKQGGKENDTDIHSCGGRGRQ